MPGRSTIQIVFIAVMALTTQCSQLSAGSYKCSPWPWYRVDVTPGSSGTYIAADSGRSKVYDARGEVFSLRYSTSPDFPEQAAACNYSGPDAISSERYPVRLKKNSGTPCWQGGLIIPPAGRELPIQRRLDTWAGREPPSSDYCNSASLVAGPSPANTWIVEGVRIHSAWDGVRMERADCDDVPGLCRSTLRDSWISDVADDCIENDALTTMTVENVLCDRVFAAVSATGLGPTGADQSNTGYQTFRRFYSRQIGREMKDGTYRHIAPFKFYTRAGQWRCQDCVFAFDYAAIQGEKYGSTWRSMWDKLKSTAPEDCRDVVLLYLGGDELPESWPDPRRSPWNYGSCMTVKTGAEAQQHWDMVRTRFIAEHADIMRAPGDPHPIR